MDQTASTASVPPASPPQGEPIDITWRGSPWSLTGLSFLNFLLTIVTLGIYSFWGKTEVRKRIWSSVRLNDEPLVYTGTGKELFLGFLIIFGVVLLPAILVIIGTQLYFGETHPVSIIAQFLFYIIAFCLFGVAIYRARRYRLSRTNWRGIRGTLVGSPWRYAWTYIWTTILILFTFGWIIPYRTHALYKRMTNEQQFGDELFKYTGDVGDIYARFAAVFFGGLAVVAAAGAFVTWGLGIDMGMFADPERMQELETDPEQAASFIKLIVVFMFLYIFVLGLLQVIYFTAITNYITRNTSYLNGSFDLKLTIPGMLWMFLSNLVIVLGSLTILQPVAMARISKYFVDRLSFHGTVDVDTIAQNQRAMDARGEGLAEAFDVDGF